MKHPLRFAMNNYIFYFSRVKSGEWDRSVNGTLRDQSYKIKDKGDIFLIFYDEYIKNGTPKNI